MIRPSSAHSSGVVRMRVTCGLCRYRLRSRNRSGTVSMAPKLHMSSAPTLTTCGMPARAAAPRRSGPAESTPPISSSHHSVVVMSATPATNPSAMSDSIARPPLPTAWNTRTS